MATRFGLNYEAVLGTSLTALAFGTIGFYDPGTLDLKTIYSDDDLGTPKTNPVVLDIAGKHADIFLSPADYRIIVKDALGATLPGGDIDPFHGGIGDSAVTVQRSDAGSVPLTLAQYVNAGWFNAKEFGAVGDGVTDDYAALAQAFTTAIASSQAGIILPAGTYMLSQPLNISNVSVIGAGAVATTFKALASFSGASVLLIDDTTGADASVDSLYQNFRIHGNRAAVGSAVIGLKLLGNVLYSQFSNIRINEVKGVGVFVEGRSSPLVRPTLLTFTNVHVSGGDTHGWQFNAGRHILMHACAAEGLGGKGFHLAGTTESMAKIDIRVPYIENVTGDGIYIGECGQTTIFQPLINGFGATASASYGIRNAGTNAIANEIYGGDYTKNASPHASSRNILYDGGFGLKLHGMPSTISTGEFQVSAGRDVSFSGYQIIPRSTIPLVFCNAQANIAQNLTRYLGANCGSQDGTEVNVSFYCTGYMTLCQLRFIATAAAAGSDTYTATLMVNGSPSTLTAATAAGGATGSDLTHEVSLVPGDTFSLKLVTSATAATIAQNGFHATIGCKI